MRRGFATWMLILIGATLILGSLAPAVAQESPAGDAGTPEAAEAQESAPPTEDPTVAPTERSRRRSASVQAAATQEIGLSRSSGSVGTTVTATLSGFASRANVAVQRDGETLGRVRVSTNGDGSYDFKVPVAARGRHEVGAVVGSTEPSVVSFSVTPKVSLSPATGKAKASFKVTLHGYAAGEQVEIRWFEGGSAAVLKSVRASTTGSANVSLRVPADAAGGEHRIEGLGGAGNRAVATFSVTGTAPAATATRTPTRTPVPSPTIAGGSVMLWVDPTRGSDENTGATRVTALRTLDEAWARVPRDQRLTTPYRILLVRGSYPENTLPNYLESRYGTASAPISIESPDGRGAAVLGGDLNIYDTRYLSLIDLAIVPNPPGDVIHCELCDHFTIRGSTLSGGNRAAHETVKINQSTNVVIRDSDISGADDNAIDFVAVQGGEITGNRIHNAGD